MTARKQTANARRGSQDAVGHVARIAPTLPGLTNHCFGCASANRHGLHLRFSENLAQGSVECWFRMPRRFEGPPGHVHGGIIATILDEAMGKTNRQKGIVALTRSMSIDYLQPVPLEIKLHVVGWPVRHEGRKHFNAAEIRTAEGKVLARGEGLFVAIDPAGLMRKYGARIADEKMAIGKSSMDSPLAGTGADRKP